MPDNLKTRIALGMICKGDGEEARLDRALSSIAPFVDGIFITLTGDTNKLEKAIDICKKYNAVVSYEKAQLVVTQEIVDWCTQFFGFEPHMKTGDKLFLFDVARNYNLSQIPKDFDWVVWMDSDDVFRGGENLHKVAEVGIRNNIEAFYFNYIYQAEFDEKGNITHRIIEHLRERLVRNNDVFKWIAPIHETLIEQRPSQKMDNYDCDVLHLATHDDRMVSLTRNLKNLEYAIYLSQGKDPRHIYYLAKAFFDLRTSEYDHKAIPLILQYLVGEDKSGWPEERQQAWEYLGELYRRNNEHNNALKAALNAFTEPTEPSPSVFLSIALTCMVKQQYELALFWVKIASSIPEKKTTLVKNTKDIQGRTLEIIYNACLNLSKVDEAWAAAEKMRVMFPEEKSVQDAFGFISRLKTERDVTKQIVELSQLLQQTGEHPKIKSLLNSVPAFVENNPFIIDLALKNNPPKAWDDDEIAIFCGPGFTNWSPKQLISPKDSFVGGSEEAVINQAQALQQQGWKVTVYGDPGNDEGEHDGVLWLPYYKFNKADHFNILVSWRQLGLFDQPLDFKKSYLWLHDIPNKMEYVPERVQKITKIIALSKWHRELLDHIPDDKFLVSSNGI